MATLAFRHAELYGGAITVDLPESWIDASDIRQVPSHQEVHLSNTSNTNLVFEINEYVTPQESFSSSSNTTTTTTESSRTPDLIDKSAILYHLHDLIDDQDTLTIITPPRKLSLQDPSLSSFPAWLLTGKVTVRTPVRNTAATSMEQVLTAPDSQSQQQQTTTLTSTTTIHLLLLRLASKQTDLCVILSVPADGDHHHQQQPPASEPDAAAEKVMATVVRTLAVREWDLFG